MGDISLTTLGLSRDASSLLRVLLRWPSLDVVDVCERAGVDHERVAAAMDELVEHGFAESAANAVGIQAVDPMIAIEHAASVQQRDLAARLSQLSELRAHLPTLAEEFARGRQGVQHELPIQVVAGRDATRKHLILLARRARVETLSMDFDSTSQGMETARADDLALLERGIPGRTLLQREVLDNHDLYRDFAILAAEGEQLRVVDRLPTRMIVYDSEVAVVPLDTADLDQGAIFIRVRTIVDTYVFFFERMWAEATPLFGAGSAASAPTGRPARVLELMASGLKDEAIARSLGIAVRTVRRDIAELTAQLGEHTRAAAIAAAMRRGWLSA